MQKNFQVWHHKKERIHWNKARPFFYEREIWSCSLGVNIGFEQDGVGEDSLRPILIFKKFNGEVCWGLPLTRTQKDGPYYYTISLLADGGKSVAILSQIRLIDVKRLRYKIGDVGEREFDEIRQKFIKIITPAYAGEGRSQL